MPAQRRAQVALDVVGERLERAHVDDTRCTRRAAAASARSRSRRSSAHRNAASVLPEPVGADTQHVLARRDRRPRLRWAAVGAANACSNQVAGPRAEAGEGHPARLARRAPGTAPVGHRLQPMDHASADVTASPVSAGAAAGTPGAKMPPGGVLPAQRLREAIEREWLVADPWRIPPESVQPAQRRPAPGRARVGAALQLPAGQRLDGRGEDRGHGLRTDRPARRRDARARPPVSRAADRGAAPAGRDPREGEPEELHGPAGRVHARAHRPQPPLRRDRRRLPRQAVPGGRSPHVRDPREDGTGAQPGAPDRGRRPPQRPRARRAPRALPAAVSRLQAARRGARCRSATGCS